MSTKVINSIKSEICSILGLVSIDAKTAKTLKEAIGLSDFKNPETWQQLLNNIKSSQSALKVSTADDNLDNDVSTIKTLQELTQSSSFDINSFDDEEINEPAVKSTETIKPVEVKQQVTVNTELKSKRKLTLYEQIKRENDFAQLKTYSLTTGEKQLLGIKAKAGHNQKDDETVSLNREDSAVLEATRKEREKLEAYNASPKTINKFTAEQIDAKLKIRAEKVKAGFKKSDKVASHIFTELDGYAKALNEVQFVPLATDSQKSVVVKARPQIKGLDGVQHSQSVLKEVAGNLDATRSVRFDRDTETKFRFEQFSLRQELLNNWLDAIEIKEDKYFDLLVGQYSEEYRQLVCAYYDWYEFLGSYRNTEGTWNSIRTTTTEEPGEYAGEIETKHETEEKELITLTELLYEELEYFEKAIDKKKPTATEKKFLSVYDEAKEVVKQNLLGKYKLDKEEITLSQWRSICLDNLGKTRDEYLSELKDLNVKQNPIAVTALLIWQNVRGKEDIYEIADVDSHAETIKKYCRLNAINRFKEIEAAKLRELANKADKKESEKLLHQAAMMLNAAVSFHNQRLLINKLEACKEQIELFNNLLEQNYKKVQEWENNNPNVKLTVFKKLFKGKYRDNSNNVLHGIYTLISKTSTKPTVFKATDEQLGVFEVKNNLSLGVIPVSLTSHFVHREVDESVKYKKEVVLTGKNRVSAVNDRKPVHFPDIPLFAKKLVNNIMVRLQPSTQHDLLAYVEWCDLSLVDASNRAKWHPYASLRIRNIKDKKIIEVKALNKHRNFSSDYKLQDGKHTATHYITMAMAEWGLVINYPVMLGKAEFQGKELKERPLYCKELCKYLGLHLKPVDLGNNTFCIELVKDERECKDIQKFKSMNPSLKHIAHNVSARTIVKAVKSAALDKVDSTEKVKEKVINEIDTTLANLLHPGITDKEVMLPDGRWLKPKFTFVKGVKTVNSYLIVKREVINVW